MKALILAGGLGKRLAPFTEIIPKPLLPIGEKSILEIQILRLKEHGFDEIFLATNYKSEYIESFFGNGSRLGVKIVVSKEEKPLGTCGPVTLLKTRLTEPFIMMNGDILTKLDFSELYKFSLTVNSMLIVATKKIMTPFHFGHVHSLGNFIDHIEEKPNIVTEILAGIYVMKPSIFDHIPENTYYGMDSLIKDLLCKKVPVAKYLMSEYWLDIGCFENFEEAKKVYKEHFEGG